MTREEFPTDKIIPITEELEKEGGYEPFEVRELVELQLILDYGFEEATAGKIAQATAERWYMGGAEICTRLISFAVNKGPQAFFEYAKETRAYAR